MEGLQVGSPLCHKCVDVHAIIQSNEQIIQQQVKIIKQLHQQKISLKEKYVLLEIENQKLQEKCSKLTQSSIIKVEQGVQTERFLEDLVEKIEKMDVQSQELQESKRVNSSSKVQSTKSKAKQINKENLQNILPIVGIRKDEQYFSRKRKNSYQEEYQATSWLKVIDSSLKLSQDTFRAKTIDLLKKMVPHELRHIVWPAVTKNTLMITQQLYFELQERKNLGWISKEVKSQIEKDINRSFTRTEQINQKEGLKIEITQVLEMFHIYRPDVSYIQGMTYPVIVLTIVTGKVKAFRIFANLVLCNNFFRKLFTFQSSFILIVSKAFQLLLFDFHSQLAEKLILQKLDPNIFLVQWFYTIFSRSLSFEATLKIWDHLLYHGQVVLYRLALSIFQLIKGHIMQTNYEDTIGLIQGFSGYIRQEKLLQMMINHKLTHQRLWKTFDKLQKCLQKYQPEQ